MPNSPPRRRKTELTPRADELAEVVLPGHDGDAVRLGDLWHKRPVALVWLRHYG